MVAFVRRLHAPKSVRSRVVLALSACLVFLLVGCGAPDLGDPGDGLDAVLGTLEGASNTRVAVALALTEDPSRDVTFLSTTVVDDEGGFELALPARSALPPTAFADVLVAFDAFVDSLETFGCEATSSAPEVQTTILDANAFGYSASIVVIDAEDGALIAKASDAVGPGPGFRSVNIWWVYADGATSLKGPAEGCIVGAGYPLFVDVDLVPGWNQIAYYVTEDGGEVGLRNDATSPVVVEAGPFN